MCACVCPIPSISQEWLDSATFCHYVIIALAFLWLSSCIFSLTKSSKKTPIVITSQKILPFYLRLALDGSIPLAYEIQIRGVHAAGCRMILRVPKAQTLPSGWQNLPKVSFFFRKIRISRQLGIHLNNDTETENIMTLIDSWQVMMFVYYVQLYGKYTQI